MLGEQLESLAAANRSNYTRKNKVKILVLAGVIVLLSGCTTNTKVPYSWVNPSIKEQRDQSQQYGQDIASCISMIEGWRIVSGAAPTAINFMPRTPLAPTYNISGQLTGYSGGVYNSYNVYGTARPMPDFGTSFSSGMADGYNMGLAIRANRDREEGKKCL